MWNAKSCPRCRGDIFLDEDVGGRFEKCLQCGYEREIPRGLNVKNDLFRKDKQSLSMKPV